MLLTDLRALNYCDGHSPGTILCHRWRFISLCFRQPIAGTFLHRSLKACPETEAKRCGNMTDIHTASTSCPSHLVLFADELSLGDMTVTCAASDSAAITVCSIPMHGKVALLATCGVHCYKHIDSAQQTLLRVLAAWRKLLLKLFSGGMVLLYRQLMLHTSCLLSCCCSCSLNVQPKHHKLVYIVCTGQVL